MHNNIYLPLTRVLTYFVLPEKRDFLNLSEIFQEIFHAKKFLEILHHYF